MPYSKMFHYKIYVDKKQGETSMHGLSQDI